MTRFHTESYILAALIALACDACAREPARAPEAAPARRPAQTAAPQSAADLGCSPAELAAPAREKLHGLATFYSDSLAGNATASGQPYDPELLTAAHRTLPFGTRVRVHRVDVRSKTLCLTVNDRGPFSSEKRIIDVSRRAAEALRMITLGAAPVEVEVL